jgi:HNH endonuclease
LVKRVSNYVEFIYCGCGCGKTCPKYGKSGKEVKYIHGHGTRKLIRSKFVNTQGYVLVYSPDHHHSDNNGYVREHRLVYEEYYKCCLLPWATIHHINQNKQDNSIDNLQGIIRSEHVRLHIDEYRISNKSLQRICIKCGSNVTRLRKHGKNQRFCYEWYKNPFNKSEWWCYNCYNRYNALRYHKRKKNTVSN